MPDHVGAFAVHRLCLPVVFGKAAEIAVREAERIGAERILCVGEAGGRTAVTPEARAVNIRDAGIPDNAGREPEGTPVVPGGPEELFSTLDAEKMAQAARDAGTPAEVSFSAGTYVCNDLFYLMLHHFTDTEVRCGFIHVPAEGELSAEQLAAGIAAAIYNWLPEKVE